MSVSHRIPSVYYWRQKHIGRQLSVVSSPAINILSNSSGQLETSPAGSITSGDGGEANSAFPKNEPLNPQPNDDPGRIRVANSPGNKLLPRLIYQLKGYFAPKVPTKEELASMTDEQQLKVLEPILSSESKAAEKRLINCLTRMNVCYMTRKNNKDIIRRVKFDKIIMGLDLIYFHINTNRLPHGVSIGQLESQDIINNLSVSVGHKINYRWNEKTGCWYVMERASGTLGIPNHVNLADLWERTPASKDSFTIPVGISQNTKPIYESLDEMVHMLIAGTTGGGKSNFLNVILCTLIRRNKPDRMQLLLVDLKGGLEFNYYGGIPHLLLLPGVAPKGIVNERNDVLPLLDWVIGEGERRMAVLLKAEAKHIGEYNAHRTTKRMPHLVVVIDEWADVKLGQGGKETEEKLANSVQRMRAVGIHVIVCTQVPQSQVLGTLIKANLPAKFAFSCADMQGSMSILNNAHALNLQPKGRSIFRFQEEIEVQTPFIPKTIILETVKGAIAGQFGELSKCDVTQEEIREWALKENNGWMSCESVWRQFKNRGLSHGITEEWLREFEGQEFLIGSTIYLVTPADYTHPRRLIVKEENSTSNSVIS